MHGIERVRGSNPGPVEPGGGVQRIVVRYSDGRSLNFVPDGARKLFTEDDILMLQKVLMRASARAEWAEVNARAESR